MARLTEEAIMADPYLTVIERRAMVGLYRALTDARREVEGARIREQRWWQWGRWHPWGKRARRRG